MGTYIKPIWIEEGPGPLYASTNGLTKCSGAIEALVADPINRDRVFVATVGGGVWRSDDAISAIDPLWIPLTDNMNSLSMTSISFDINDVNRNTLYAGCGSSSHADPIVGGTSSAPCGLLKTTDGGNTWEELRRDIFGNYTISRILAMGHSVLVATRGGGLFRSYDAGQNWLQVAKEAGIQLSDLAVHPQNEDIVYTAGTNGIFRSSDPLNVIWTSINGNLGNIDTGDIRISVSKIADDDGAYRIHIVISDNKKIFGLYYSADEGATWVNMGMPPDGSKPTFPFIASPISAYIVFCTSDSGRHWMVNQVPGNTSGFGWLAVDQEGASGTAPHTDGRACAFSADTGYMFDTNDGGIYRLVNPHNLFYLPYRHWEEAAGNLRITEFHNLAYDAVNRTLFGATQDNSIPHQTATGSFNWGINEENWGDGFGAGADNISTPGASVHYSSQQNFYHSKRITYNSPTTAVAVDGVPFIVNGTGGLGYNVVEGALTDDPNDLGTVQWNQNWVLNTVDPTRMLIGTDYLYESFDRGNTFNSLGGLSKSKKGEWIPANPVGTVTAYAYGCYNNADVIYVGAGGDLYVRSSGTGLPAIVSSYPGSVPVGIVLRPGNWQHAFVLDDNGKVWLTVDGGATATGWSDFTGNLSSITTDLRAIELMPSYPNPDVVFVAGYGGVYICAFPKDARFAFWQKFGFNFPNALVTKIIYNKDRDIMFAGTLGRSAWSLYNVQGSFLSAPTLGIRQTGIGDCYGGWAENTSITLEAKIDNIQDLVLPIQFNWDFHGTANAPIINSYKISATLPKAGTEVIITLAVTDATGYKLFAYLTGFTITQEEANLRSAFCNFIHRFKLIPIPFWEWDPERIISFPELTLKQQQQLVRHLDIAVQQLNEIKNGLKNMPRE